MRHLLAGSVALLIAGTALLAQQQPPVPTFRVQVDAIEMDAFVTDAQGKPVTGLTVNDFQIFEDGKPQLITSFTQVDIPFERRTESFDVKGAVDPDVVSNDHSDGRVYMFLLDEVSPAVALRARVFLKRFLSEHFAANDRGAVIFLGRQNTRDGQMFTNDPRLLATAVDRYTGGFGAEDAPGPIVGQDDNPADVPAPPDVSGAGTAPTPAPAGAGGAGGAAGAGPGGGVVNLLRGANNRLGDGLAANKQAEANSVGLSTMAGLESAVSMMARLQGRRKALLLFSSGLHPAIFRALTYDGGAMTKVEQAAHAAVTAATRGSVTIYAVDPAGLSSGLADARGVEAPDQAVATDSSENRMSLSMLSDATGGFSLVNSNGFTAAFDRIVRENSTYYLLGFTSSNDKRDGKHRSLRVRVTRPGLRVRAREGYVAPLKNERLPEPPHLASLSQAVSNSVTNPLSDGTVPIRLFAAPYRREAKSALVAIVAEIDPAALGLTERDGVFKGELEIGFLANDTGGRIYPGQHYTADLALKAETYHKARQQQGLRVLSEIQLPPGRYQLRFAAGNSAGKAGNVVYDLTVPDFRKDRLMLSGLALTSASTSVAGTVAPKDPLKQFLPRPMTTRREFASGDTIGIFGEAYDNVSPPESSSIDVIVDLRAQDGRLVRTESVHTSRFMIELPLADVAAGQYVIHVDAHTTSGRPLTAARDIQIRVR